MKNSIIISLFFMLLSHLGMAQYLKSTFPIDGMVFQRDANDQADVYFSAQYTDPASVTLGYTAQYRLQPLHLQTGVIIGSPTSWTTISFNNNVGFFRTIYGSIPSLNKGWYRLELRIIAGNNVVIETSSTKFGVGDIFIMAGQSNAMGYNYLDDNNVVPYYNNGNYSNGNLPESVTINPNGILNNSANRLSSEAGSKQSSLSTFVKLKQQGNEIFPYGVDSWCYAVLGKDIQAITQAPITFFNSGASSSGSINWRESLNGDSTNNLYTSQLFYGYAGLPYSAFRNTLQMFGSIMGVRSIMWHQGEADSDGNLTNYEYYKQNLNQVIAQAEQDFRDDNDNPINNLSWYISKVSWNGATNNGGNYTGTTNQFLISKQLELIDNQDKKLGADTDGIEMKSNPFNANDFTRAANGLYNQNIHFSDYGLKMLADSWKNAQPWQGNPIKGKPLLPITMAFANGPCNAEYNLTAPSGYAKYYWVKKGDVLSSFLSDQQTLSNVTFQTEETLICYVSKSANPNKMNFFACQPVYLGSPNIAVVTSAPSFITYISPTDDITSSTDKIANIGIMASNSILNNGTRVNYNAGNFISLENGFYAAPGTIFNAEIGGCQSSSVPYAPWYNDNIGAGTGSASFSGTTLSINGTGSPASSLTDDLHYYHRTFTGDVNIDIRIDSMSNTNGQRAGIMIRNNLDANSGFYELVLDGAGAVAKLKRKNPGDLSGWAGLSLIPSLNGVWLRITKTENTIKCYFKPTDASNWLEIIGLDDHSDNSFNSNYEVGFVAYGGSTAKFSKIYLNGILVP